MSTILREKLETAEKRVAELEQQAEEHEQSFNLRWNADMRAIRRWQESTGRVLTWPSHTDLCVWLLERIAELEARMEEEKEHSESMRKEALRQLSEKATLQNQLAQAKYEIGRIAELESQLAADEANGVELGRIEAYHKAIKPDSHSIYETLDWLRAQLAAANERAAANVRKCLEIVDQDPAWASVRIAKAIRAAFLKETA